MKKHRHASIRLKERYGIEKSDSLLRKLESEISSGNFLAISSSRDSTKGYVNLSGEIFEVVINNKSKIITALPKGSLSAEKTRKYQGR